MPKRMLNYFSDILWIPEYVQLLKSIWSHQKQHKAQHKCLNNTMWDHILLLSLIGRFDFGNFTKTVCVGSSLGNVWIKTMGIRPQTTQIRKRRKKGGRVKILKCKKNPLHYNVPKRMINYFSDILWISKYVQLPKSIWKNIPFSSKATQGSTQMFE